MIIKNKFWFNVVKFVMGQLPFIAALIIGIIVGLIWNGIAGFFTFFGIGVAFVLFIMGRQLWWWITKTGDYKDETENKEG
jgi:hypothetical protein